MTLAINVEGSKGKAEKKGELLNKRKFAKLIDDYAAFKKKNVRHFRYSAEAKSTNYGKFHIVSFSLYQSCSWSGVEIPVEQNLRLVRIYFDTATFDDIERDEKIKTEAQLSLIGGTMGLFSGFSIISGVEIIFFLAKLLYKGIAHCKAKYRDNKGVDN